MRDGAIVISRQDAGMARVGKPVDFQFGGGILVAFEFGGKDAALLLLCGQRSRCGSRQKEPTARDRTRKASHVSMLSIHQTRRLTLPGGGTYIYSMLRKPILATMLVWLLALPAHAQTARTDKVRAQAQNLTVGGKATINMLDGAQYCGAVASIDPDSLLMHEVDLKRDLTLRYDTIQRIRKGYGRPGFGGRRVYPRTNLIAGVAILGGLITLVVVAVVADKS